MILVIGLLVLATGTVSEEHYGTSFFKSKCTVSYRSTSRGCETPTFNFPECLPWDTRKCTYIKSTRKKTECSFVDCMVSFISHFIMIDKYKLKLFHGKYKGYLGSLTRFLGVLPRKSLVKLNFENPLLSLDNCLFFLRREVASSPADSISLRILWSKERPVSKSFLKEASLKIASRPKNLTVAASMSVMTVANKRHRTTIFIVAKRCCKLPCWIDWCKWYFFVDHLHYLYLDMSPPY